MEDDQHCASPSLNLNNPPPGLLLESSPELDSLDSNSDHRVVPRKRKRTLDRREIAAVYQDTVSSKGGLVKGSGQVLHVCAKRVLRKPTVNCRVESFGKICDSFDDRRRKWVPELGFGGLLFLVCRKLRRDLYYLLMNIVDPVNEMLNIGVKQYRLSSTQVKWVLWLPKGEMCVLSEFLTKEGFRKVNALEKKYGLVWTSVEGKDAKVVTREGFAVLNAVVKKLISEVGDDEANEFKMLFLMTTLDMVLCPTKCSRFPKELVRALCCYADAKKYNWCDLVVDKLMPSARCFGKRFYEDGFAIGCSGCTLFLAIFYLDRLNYNAVQWGTRP